MAKRGRPRKNGVKGGWVFSRAIHALYGYGTSRMADEKYSEALKAGVAEVRQTFPGMPISQTEVKRVLAEFQSKAQPLGLWVAKPESSHTMVVDDIGWGRTLAFGFGLPPNYPRHNATDKTRKGRAKTDLQPTKS
jgi:hypothetical protein